MVIAPVPEPGPRLPRLAAVLHREGLTLECFHAGREVLVGAPAAARAPLLDRLLRRRGPAGCLTALLAFDLPQQRADLPPAALAELDAQGLLVPAGDAVRSGFRVTPVADLLLMSDHATAGDARVMTPGVTTAELAWALPRPPGRRVLDVGTGSGVLGLLAAAQGSAAVATDVSARACAVARVNAAMAGLPLDVRQGSLLAPVAGERFDLVVSQPPYIPCPAGVDDATWLHGGPLGDELAHALLTGLPGVLAAGGQAVLRVDLAPDRADAQQLQDRTGLHDLDVVLVTWPSNTREELAFGYAATDDGAFGSRYAQAVVAYAQHLEERGVDDMLAAIVLVRRRSGGGAVVGASRSRSALTWEQLQQRAAALALAEAGDGVLLRARLQAPQGARVCIEQDVTGDLAVGHVLRYPQKSPYCETTLSETGALVLQLLAGGRGVGALVAGYAEQLGQQPEDVVRDVLDFVRLSLKQGLLLVAE